MTDHYPRGRMMDPRLCCAIGVTLIELLVVVAMIALLLAMLLPSLSMARQQARRMSCASCLHSLGRAVTFYSTEMGRYPLPGDRTYGPSRPTGVSLYRPTTKLTDITDIAEGLVSASLGDPRAMYCPSSVETDRCAPKPYVRRGWNGQLLQTWRTGAISYMYLVGLDYQSQESRFPDADGLPTFNPATESPEKRVNRVNPRTVLLGDRTVEIVPPNRNIPGSNHGREGGWFFFTSGDAQWWGWNRLAAHPTSIYVWYWPRMARPACP